MFDIDIQICIYMYTCMHQHLHVYMCVCIHSHVSEQAYMYICRLHVEIYTRTCLYAIYMYIHVRMYIHGISRQEDVRM